MSLVGPRPERPEFVRTLEAAIPLYRQRLEVLPGVTGLAQVYLPPDTDLESVRLKLAFDYFYIQQKSIWLDLKLIAITALQVVGVPFHVSRALFLFPPASSILTWYGADFDAGHRAGCRAGVSEPLPARRRGLRTAVPCGNYRTQESRNARCCPP